MHRRFQLDPQAFLEILHSGGCSLGPKSDVLQYVTHPGKPGKSTTVRLDQDITEKEIERHLFNLGIQEEDFLRWHERYMAPFRN